MAAKKIPLWKKIARSYDFLSMTRKCKTIAQLRSRINSAEHAFFNEIFKLDNALDAAKSAGKATSKIVRELGKANFEINRWGEAAMKFEEDWKNAAGNVSKLKNPKRKLPKKFKYSMHASGYGPAKYAFCYKKTCIEAMKRDAECVAGDCGGTVGWHGSSECVVVGPNGNEVARFELMFDPSK